MCSLPLKCPFTNSTDCETIFTYDQPPPGENKFDFIKKEDYKRSVVCFKSSGHYLGIHDIDVGFLYSGDYNDSIYNDEKGLQDRFDKVMALPYEKSDNRCRAANLSRYAEKHFGRNADYLTLLDIGSGTGVFVATMKENGFNVSALDPDERSTSHIKNNIQCPVICADFMMVDLEQQYDIISFNKVLEHVIDPISMLGKVAPLVKEGGIVYIEVPDGEIAARNGKNRLEFVLEHWHIFSFTSAAMLADQAGFDVLYQERLREPSGKFTLRTIAAPKT